MPVYLLSNSSKSLSVMSGAWLYLFSICPSLSPSSSLSLIVSVWLERLPLSMVLMGSFHRGLRLEWIDRRRYPCCGKFANCVWAQCCCSSSYSSSCQDIGKSQLQLCAPSLGPAGQMWPGALRAGFGRGLLHPAAACSLCQAFLSLHQLHCPVEVISYLARQVVSTVRSQCCNQGCG